MDEAHRGVYARHVDLGHELDTRRLVGIPIATVDVHGVDAAVVCRVARPNDGACPGVHLDVVGVGHAVAHGAIADALLALLELF